MTSLFHDIPVPAAERNPDAPALETRRTTVCYGALVEETRRAAANLGQRGLQAGARVAVYLDKRPETVTALLAISRAGAIAVPVNPALKPRQVAHILADSGAQGLITSSQRLQLLRQAVALDGSSLNPALTLCVDDLEAGWPALARNPVSACVPPVVETDPAMILYTSGSTGRPKGVALSHRNLVAGVESVVQYLGITAHDRLLAALPLSFDYGLNQVTTALSAGGSVFLHDYLWPRELVRLLAGQGITGLAGVPPLWNQLVQEQWPTAISGTLRYITNSGGKLPATTLRQLQARLPATRIFLMYGLTEAFRSTYLPPEELDRRPDSMGRPIPNARVDVLRPDGTPCEPDETGELVHSGPLVALGYWNDPFRTAERFRPAPGQPEELPGTQTAVWSGDLVNRDGDGYFYFQGRRDDMIKSSGYRISPTEIEEVLHDSGLVKEAAAVGVPHTDLGDGIVVIAVTAEGVDDAQLRAACQHALPAFMVPAAFVQRQEPLPRGPNGKIDRSGLRESYWQMFGGN